MKRFYCSSMNAYMMNAAIVAVMLLFTSITIFGQGKAKIDEKKLASLPDKPPIELRLKDKPLAEKPAFVEKKAQATGMKTVQINEFTSMTVPANYEVNYYYSPEPKNMKMEKTDGDKLGIQPKEATIRIGTGRVEGVTTNGNDSLTYSVDLVKNYQLYSDGNLIYAPISKKDSCNLGSKYPDTKFLVMSAYYIQNVTGDPATAIRDFVQKQTGRYVPGVSIGAPQGTVSKYVFIFAEYQNQNGEPVNSPAPGIFAQGMRDEDLFPFANLHSTISVAATISVRDEIDSKNYKSTLSMLNIGGFVADNQYGYVYPTQPGVEVQTITSVKELPGMPTDFRVSQNYPNPFNPSTKIRVEVSRTAKVSLRVFNMLGEEVATLANNVMSPGNYEFEFNGKNLASGVYFYTVSVDGQLGSSRKMILIK